MRKVFLFACAAWLAAACNNAANTGSTAMDSTAKSSSQAMKDTMPYQLARPWQNWQPGNSKHAYTVMSALKAFETGDIPACINGFADSVRLFFDNMRGKFSKDSLGKMFTAERANYTSMSIQMEDWESVISADKKEEWVTLWYKQKWTNTKGITDSINCVDDAMIKDGKIAVLSEAVQHYPAK